MQMTSSCKLPWQRWHCVQRREKRSSRAFRCDTWAQGGLSRTVGSGLPQLRPPPHSPPSDRALTPVADRTHTQLLGEGWASARGAGTEPGPSLHPCISALLRPRPIPASESPQRLENKGLSVRGKLPWGTPGRVRTPGWSAGRMEPVAETHQWL